MNYRGITLLSLLFTAMAQGQSLEPFFSNAQSLPPQQQQAAVDSFMRSQRTFPVVENDTTVVFIIQRAAKTVSITGDAMNWNPKGVAMTRLGSTDLWFCRRIHEADARVDYKYIINGTDWVLDDRNPLICTGGFGANSELRMPRYVQNPESQFYPDIPHGALHDTTLHSKSLGNSRLVRIYTPPGYETSKENYPVILFHDGLEYITLAQANNTLDYLIWQKRIAPVVAVFVPPVNRTDEYVDDQIEEFSEFIVHDVVGVIDASYRTLKTPSARAVIGASNGGNISLWLGSHYAHVFGNVGAQSSNIVPWLMNRFQSGEKLGLRLYLDLGTYDIPVLIKLVRKFVPILEAQKYDFTYHEYHEGHSWGNWRARVGEALRFFFGTESKH
jgi:enterochelin esterase family protein